MEIHNQTFCNVGDNNFAVEHTGVRKRQREETLKKVVQYDKEGGIRQGVRLDGIESPQRRGRLVGIFPSDTITTDAFSPRKFLEFCARVTINMV